MEIIILNDMCGLKDIVKVKETSMSIEYIFLSLSIVPHFFQKIILPLLSRILYVLG